MPGGPFDALTLEQRSRIFIPATNDANEGALGSWRVWRRYHPTCTATSFSNKTRAERNNTELFIEKHCNDDDHLYVMRQVRAIGASGENAQFRQDLIEDRQKQALATRKKQEDAERKKQQEIDRLIAVGLIVDRTAVERMTVPQLDDQLKIHKQFLKDDVLAKVKQKDMKTKALKLQALLAAITRNEGWVQVQQHHSSQLVLI